MNPLRKQVDRDGFAVIERVVARTAVEQLIGALSAIPDDGATRRRAGSSFARRNLMEVRAVAELSRSEEIRKIVVPVLGESARPVRGILFDKTAGANWVVPWHQDVAIAVERRLEVAGFGPWSVKAGVPHVQPPVDVLRQMLTVRLHLDDCGPENGPLRVVPGSHHRLLKSAELATTAEGGAESLCTAVAGGAVVMRPMILHASSPARAATHRRVIHLEYAACGLPGGLQWARFTVGDQE